MISNDNILKVEIKRKIYQFIDKNPGLHIREVCRRMDIPKSTLLHHLKTLKKLELIDERKDGKQIYLYTKMNIGSQNKQWLKILRNEIQCKIFIYLCFSRVFSIKELSEELDIMPNTLNYHLNKLVKIGIIEKVNIKNGIVYTTSKELNYIKRKSNCSEKIYRPINYQIINEIEKILITYKKSFVNKDLIQIYLDWFENVKDSVNKYGLPKRHMNSQYDHLIEFVNDIVRPPFCA